MENRDISNLPDLSWALYWKYVWQDVAHMIEPLAAGSERYVRISPDRAQSVQSATVVLGLIKHAVKKKVKDCNTVDLSLLHLFVPILETVKARYGLPGESEEFYLGILGFFQLVVVECRSVTKFWQPFAQAFQLLSELLAAHYENKMEEYRLVVSREALGVLASD